MEPTLEINDRVLVLKDALTPINIESGDIVIFTVLRFRTLRTF